jgi:hypothetical protein
LYYYPVYTFKEKKMHTIARTPTTDMEVTSIRLERELKDKLKEIAGNQGYQALIRDILWNYVQQKSGEWKPRFSRADIRASIAATAQQEERCVLTGQLIPAQQPMLLGLTRNGDMVPLSVESLAG